MRPKFAFLSKLPKSTRWTSANYRFQTPGLVEPLFPGYKPYRNGPFGSQLDPQHPAANLRLGVFPRSSEQEAFGGRVVPMALLITGASAFGPLPFMKWRERVEKAHQDGFSGTRIGARFVLCQGKDEKGRPVPFQGTEQAYPKDDHNTLEIPSRNATPKQPYLDYALRRAARRVPISFSIATSKKRMGTRAFMRAKIVKRIRGVVDLLVSRGAYVGQGESKEILFNEEDTGRKWSMQGWTYMFFPTTDVYRMPLPDLISAVRKTLTELNSAAIKMENVWLAEALWNLERSALRRPGWTDERRDTVEDRVTDPSAGLSELDFIYRVRSTKKSSEFSSKLRNTPSSASATGNKSHDAWKTELEASMLLLSGQTGPRDTTGASSSKNERTK